MILQPPRILIGTGFLLLLLTSLQGWAMVAIIATENTDTALLQELKRLHNLGLAGGFLAIAFGLSMAVLALDAARSRTINRILSPSLLIAPIAFTNRVWLIVFGSIPQPIQIACYALQAVSALGITVSLVLMLVAILRPGKQSHSSRSP
jgi:hypothetical protein